MNNSPDFYLASSEGYDMEEPRKCYQIKRLHGDKRDDYLLIKIDPPLIGQNYGLGSQDIDKVIIATRYKADLLFPIKNWPVDVHVARILGDDPEKLDFIDTNKLEEIGWAELYKSESEAKIKTQDKK